MTTLADSVIDYSIVIPVYFNEGSLTGTMESIKTEVIARNPSLRCEVVFVDDGSGDGSLAELLRLRENDPQTVKVIKLTRNFGQVNALLAGFSYARGKCVVAMSADGQDPAALIHEMLKGHFEERYEIVACARQGRDESYYRVWTSRVAYALIRRLSFPNMPRGGFDFVLLGRRALDVFLRNQEAHLYLQGHILWTGFRTKFIEYRRRKRTAGESRASFGVKLTYLVDGVIGYSYFPLRLMSGVGILAALVGFLYALVIIVIKLVWGNPVQGWAPIMVVILVIGGLQMLMLGIIGEYLWRTLAQVRRRDPYVIETTYDDGEGSVLRRHDT